MSGVRDLGGSITQEGRQNKLPEPSDWPICRDLPAPLPGPIWGHRNWSLFMSAAEQLEDPPGGVPPRRDALLEEEAFIESQLTQSPAKTGAKLRPLLALAPYVTRYRGRAHIGVHLADRRGGDDPGGADRGAAHDRLRLQPRRHRDDQQLFQRDDRGRCGAGLRQRVAVLSGDDDRRAHRCGLCGATCSRT